VNCPECGRPLTEGKAYCENPACGAVPGQGQKPATRTIKIEKRMYINVKLDQVKIVVVFVGGLIFALIYFWMMPGK